jgi:hypothetical protein
MLLVKYLVEDYDSLDTETKCDIYNAIKKGYIEGNLNAYQVRALVLYAHGYNPEEINSQLHITGAETLVVSALRYVEEITHFTDYGVIKKYKGEVQPLWIAIAQKVALETW